MLAALAGSPAIADVEVTACGQEFSGRGYLSADLSCSGEAFGVRIVNGALDLRGFRISGAVIGVRCSDSCKVSSDPPGGEISSNTGDGIFGFRLILSDLVVSQNGGSGVLGQHVKAKRIVANDNAGAGGVGAGIASGPTRLRVLDSTVTGNVGHGVFSTDRPKVVDTLISGNGGVGVRGLQQGVTIKRSEVLMNSGGGIHNVAPSQGRVAHIKDARVEANGLFGILDGPDSKAIATRSTFAGNDTDSACAVTVTCADFDTYRTPILNKGTSCETSHVAGSGSPGTSWGVCSLD